MVGDIGCGKYFSACNRWNWRTANEQYHSSCPKRGRRLAHHKYHGWVVIQYSLGGFNTGGRKMKRLSMAVILIALAGTFVNAPSATASGAPIIPICFSYHSNISVQTFTTPTRAHCPKGYAYGAGTITTTAQLITMLDSVSKNNYKSGTSYGKSVVRKCIATQKPSTLVRSLKC